VTSVENGKSVAVSVSHSWTSLAPGLTDIDICADVHDLHAVVAGKQSCLHE